MHYTELVDGLVVLYEKMRLTMTPKQAATRMLLAAVGVAMPNLKSYEILATVRVALGGKLSDNSTTD